MTAMDRPLDLLRRYTAPQRWSVVLMAVLVLASIGLALAEPNIVKQFIVSVQGGSPWRTLVTIALVFLLVAGARQVMHALGLYWSERVGWTATNMLRADLMAHVLGLDLSFHESRSPGELIERIDGDVNGINAFFSSFIVDILGNALLLVGILTAVTIVDPRIGLCFAALTVLGMILLVRVSRVGVPLWQRNRQESALFYGELGEVLQATEDLRTSGAQAYAMARFFRRVRSWLPVEIKAATWGSSVWVATIVLFTTATMLAYGIGGSLFGSGQLALSDLYLVVAYALMLTGPMEAIRNQLQYLQQAAAAVGRIRGLLGVRSRLPDGTRQLPGGPLPVAFRAVSFAYPVDQDAEPRPVLRDLSFSVRAGRTLGIVGRTGAGKSTIASLLFRSYDVLSGEVRVGDHDVRDLHLASLRSRIGLVTQDVTVFTGSLRDNLALFDAEIGDDRLVDVLTTLGLGPWLARLPDGLDSEISAGSLSAGEAQLVAFARVFLKEPGLLILDEPSSRLDPATQALLESAIDVLVHDRTVIMIAHRLETLSRADEILVIDDGQIIEHGERQRLLNDPQSRFTALHRAGALVP